MPLFTSPRSFSAGLNSPDRHPFRIGGWTLGGREFSRVSAMRNVTRSRWMHKFCDFFGRKVAFVAAVEMHRWRPPTRLVKPPVKWDGVKPQMPSITVQTKGRVQFNVRLIRCHSTPGNFLEVGVEARTAWRRDAILCSFALFSGGKVHFEVLVRNGERNNPRQVGFLPCEELERKKITSRASFWWWNYLIPISLPNLFSILSFHFFSGYLVDNEGVGHH